MPTHRNLSRFQYMAQDVMVNDKEAILMMNGQGQIMSKSEFDEMVRLGQRFYGSENVSEWIESENRKNRWLGHPLLGTERVDGKYILPEPRIEERTFRKNLQRNWSFTCQWCEQKVSSATDTHYYRIHQTLTPGHTIAGNNCSPACAENVWYDLIIEWITDEDLKETFHTDKTIKGKG